MKNKALTYILILVVALVWGIIIYRIIGAAGSDDEVPVVNRAVIQKIRTEDYAEVKDSTHLLLNYPDPFIKEDIKSLKNTEKPAELPKGRIPGRIAPAINWSFINYTGFIKNARSKKTLSILTINGKQYTLNEGEIGDNVKLLKNMIDSVKVLYQGNSKFIIINNK